jgi:hypothetical protein
MAIKLEINMTNKWLYSLIAVCIVLALGVGVYAYTSSIPNPGHGGDSVLISINGQEKTIQQAIDDGDLASSTSEISSLKTRVIECNGNCGDEGTPNAICSNSYGSSYKALSVDCECIEVWDANQNWDRNFNSNLDWCCDTGGEDITVTCYS